MNATTTTRTFLISAMGLVGGETLHYNNTVFSVVTAEAGERYTRVYYAAAFGGMDFLVFKNTDMVTVS